VGLTGQIPNFSSRESDTCLVAVNGDILTNCHDVMDLTDFSSIFCDFDMDDMRGCGSSTSWGKESDMAKILAVATHGTDDPTKCTLAFATAVGALGAGKEASIALLGEAAYLAKASVPQAVHGVGFPPLTELVEKVVKGNVPVYV